MGSDTSLTAPVVVSIQEATALLLQGSGSDSGSGLMSMSSSHGHQHQHHHHHQHQHQHQHHVHDHHLLMDQPHLSLDSMHRGESSTTANTHGHKQQQQDACTTATTNTARMSPPLLSTDVNVSEILSCSLCTYSDVCLIPQAKIVVRTYRTRTGGPLMQVLDWTMQYSIDLGLRRPDDGEMSDPEDVNDESDGETETESVMGEEEEEEEEGHQDLISGMDVNDKGTLLVSCSIDGTVRVWDVLVTEFGNDACQPAVAIEDITVVSGGSDHTVRIWDALSGSLLRLIPDLFTTRDLDLGVFTVAIHKALPCSTPITTSESGIVAVGSVIEGYQLFSLSTGDLVMELDEPLTSRQHTEFETELYQQYAAKVAITETAVVTNSKLKGMLCVWCRRTGELLYRIRVCPPPAFGEGGVEKQQRKRRRKMVSCGLRESSRIASNSRRLQGQEEEEDGETIHTFKVNKSGSMLMCTLCDGRVALFEFGKSRKCAIETEEEEEEMMVSMLDCIDSRRRSGSDFGGVAIVGEDDDAVGGNQQYFLQSQEQHQAASATTTPTAIPTAGAAVVQEEVEGVEEEGEGSGYACGGEMLAWIWFRDQCDNQRVVLM
ncbi:hypothetical protein BKA57DRAFT_494844 [Linnemannia elongata]|nr:hypothetical protein BKA57DRAFT_494844 [Linnemannia elongata]